MAGFLIKKSVKKKKIIEIEYEKKGYDFKPRINSQEFEINKITIFNHSMINSILTKKIDTQFKRVAAITYDVLNDEDDDSTSDAIIALDEVSKLKAIILKKYQEFLEKEKEKKYLKQIRVLENQLKAKINYEKEKMIVVEEKKGRGR